jgi:hypothetical protein
MKNSRFQNGSDKRLPRKNELQIIHLPITPTKTGQIKKKNGMRVSEKENNFDKFYLLNMIIFMNNKVDLLSYLLPTPLSTLGR